MKIRISEKVQETTLKLDTVRVYKVCMEIAGIFVNL